MCWSTPTATGCSTRNSTDPPMYALIGMPQAGEWLIVLGLVALCFGLPIAVIVWLVVKLAARRSR